MAPCGWPVGVRCMGVSAWEEAGLTNKCRLRSPLPLVTGPMTIGFTRRETSIATTFLPQRKQLSLMDVSVLPEKVKITQDRRLLSNVILESELAPNL